MASPEPIFLLPGDGKLVELVEEAYEKEVVLQELLAAHPQLLASVGSAQEPGRWLLIEREAALPSSAGGPGHWSVDHLFVDAAGIPTMVEVKRSSNTQIRREVVGQMLDYAANAVVYWPVESLIAKFEATSRAEDMDPETRLRDFLEPNVDSETFWQTVKTNLEAAKVRLVFVSDAIPPELRRIVEFLNEQMTRAEVLAVEVRQFKSKEGTVLVPHLIGRTASAETVKSSGSRQQSWDRTSILEELRAKSDGETSNAAGALMDWAAENGMSGSYGKGAVDGSWSPSWDAPGGKCSPITIWTFGKVEVNFEYLKKVPAFQRRASRAEVARRMEQVFGEKIPEAKLDKRPSFPAGKLRQSSSMNELQQTLLWIRERSGQAVSRASLVDAGAMPREPDGDASETPSP